MCGEEQQFIETAFNENCIAPFGTNISGFENDIENYLEQDRYATAVNSGTSAIHLALILLGISDNDEVICQSNTFIASVNPIIYVGAKPVFVDSELDTWNMDPHLLEIAIKERILKGKKPKAIVTVHLYGMPYKVDEIHALAKSYDIPIIEDCAEALGSSYKNQKCGTFGDLSILSFNANKIITTSGGGVLISRLEKLKESAIFYSTQAKDLSVDYSHSEIGYNYRMSNIAAGIGRGQMLCLDNHVDLRRKIFSSYKNALEPIETIRFSEEPARYFSNRWLTCILTDSFEEREEIRTVLDSNTIESRPLWKPMHQQTVFKNASVFLNGNSDELHQKGLCLPSGSNLTEREFESILNCFIEIYGQF
jgi:dTDP-4-amino-4,6-dideoxygalactose transaminase